MYSRASSDRRSNPLAALSFATILCFLAFLAGCSGGSSSGSGVATGVGAAQQPDYAAFVTDLIQNQTREDTDPVEINGLEFGNQFDEDETAFQGVLGN